MSAARERAERRILPAPLASDVDAALAPGFDGETELRAYEMRAEEIVRGLLVPSNQAEYLPEIDDAGSARGDHPRADARRRDPGDAVRAGRDGAWPEPALDPRRAHEAGLGGFSPPPMSVPGGVARSR